MSIRNENKEYEWALARRHREAADQRQEAQPSELPRLGETVTELGITIAGFVGIILLIYALLDALR
jgi:hypothetical protein